MGDDAIFNLAQIYDNNKNDKIKAAELYKKLLFEYQDSIYGVDARKRYREINGDSTPINNTIDPYQFDAN